MKLVKQVVNLELAKRLKELGVKQESALYWHGAESNPFLLLDEMRAPEDVVLASAFTVAELGEMLPWPIVSGINRSGKFMCYDDSGNTFTRKWFGEGSEIEVRAKMLIALIESNLIPHTGKP